MPSRPHKRRRLSGSPSDDELSSEGDSHVSVDPNHDSSVLEPRSTASVRNGKVDAATDPFNDSDAGEGIDEDGEEEGGDEEEKEEDSGADDVSEIDDNDLVESNGASRAPFDNSNTAGLGKNGLKEVPRIAKPQNAQLNTNRGARSSIMKLEVEEMLKEVTPKYGKKEAAAEDMLRELKAIIETMPNIKPLQVSEAERMLLKSSKIAIPFSTRRPPPDAKYSFEFRKPANINVTGSYVLKTATRLDGRISMDLVVTMPVAIFTEKDYLDYRYFHKRAYYLACIAATLQSSAGARVKLSFHCLHDNPLLPVIHVQSRDEDTDSAFAQSHCDIFVVPAAPEDIFPISKLLPNRGCVRVKDSGLRDQPSEVSTTPFYNSALRADSSITSYLKFLHGVGAKCAGFRESCLLGRIWLRQRGIHSSLHQGGFGSFEWAVLTALLLQGGGPQGKPVLLQTYDGYQLFRATLQFLALRNLSKQPLAIPADHADILKDTSRAYDIPIVFDSVRGVNVLYKMTSWSYKILQFEAQNCIRTISTATNPFDTVFIQKLDEPFTRFDLLARIKVSLRDENEPHKLAFYSAVGLYNALIHALGNRISLLSITASHEKAWRVNTSRSQLSTTELIIAVVLDTANASRTIDRGPPAEEVEAAAAFRKFWGTKAELRRFKDGQILECVAWNGIDAFSIIKEIIDFVLESQSLSTNGESHKYFGNDFTSMAYLRDINRLDSSLDDVAVAFRELETQIRSLEGLPLQIRQLQLAESTIRQTFTSKLSATLKQSQAPINVVLQFEGSSRWPDDLSAIQMTKIAFFLKLAELLSHVPKITLITRIGLENDQHDILNRAFLDVMHPTGPSFRLRIHHDREITLLERQLTTKSGGASGISREEVAIGIAEYKRNYLTAPLHAQAMRSLATRQAALAPTVRAVQAWFTAHLLSSHFAPELIELLAARAFLTPQPWTPPSSAMTGLLRVLAFLSTWDWEREPLIVDFGTSSPAASTAASPSTTDGLSKSDLETIHTRFTAWRKIDPSLNRVTIFAATNFDRDGATWTERQPGRVVAARMTALSRAACKAVREKGMALDIGTLFKSPLKDFDFVLHMSPRFTFASTTGKPGAPDLGKQHQSRFKNLQQQQQSLSRALDPALQGYAPAVLFFDELRRLYGECTVLFHNLGADGGGGNGGVIAGLWAPGAAAPRRWKIGLPYSTVPVEATGQGVEGDGEERVDAVVNKSAVLAEIARLGGDLVLKIDVHGALDG